MHLIDYYWRFAIVDSCEQFIWAVVFHWRNQQVCIGLIISYNDRACSLLIETALKLLGVFKFLRQETEFALKLL